MCAMSVVQGWGHLWSTVSVCYVSVATRMGPPVEYSTCVLCLCRYKDGAGCGVQCLCAISL